MRREEKKMLRLIIVGDLLQSPEGDWADCDAFRAFFEDNITWMLLQSPEGDWAD